MTNPLWNKTEHRPRAFVRIFLQCLILVVILIGFEFIVSMLYTYAQTNPSNPGGISIGILDTIVSYITQLVTLLGFVASIFLAGRWLDHRPFSGFGFNFSRKWWRDMGFGLILGTVLMLFIFLVELTLGWIKITGTFTNTNPGSSFVLAELQILYMFICVGIYEELFVRGYLLLNIAEGLNFDRLGSRGAVILATVISSIIFSVLHAMNPGASWMSTANLFVSGIFLASGYILTGELAIPIGIHITWNFFQGAVFGFPVSGGINSAHFISIQQIGPALGTGAEFGPEAGVIGLFAMMVGTVAVYWWKKPEDMSRLLLRLHLSNSNTQAEE